MFFSLTALIAGIALALTTYAVARSFLVGQRASVARTQAFANAKVINDQLSADPTTIGDIVGRLRTEGGGFAKLVVGDKEFLTDASFPATAFPIELSRTVEARHSGDQYFSFDQRPFLAVGVYLASTGAHYFEAFPLTDTERTLRAIATAMVIGAIGTTLVAAALGWWASRRLLRPVSRLATAAGELASGGLDTRMSPESDPDLGRLATSFNDMADAVQTRIQREARFASDVSHELRSPITALTAAVEVLRSRRDDLPERSRQALDLVVAQVQRFDQMVLDLLELSRIDAGATDVHRESVAPAQLATRIAHRYGFDGVPVTVDHRLPPTVQVDKLRFERILANLLDNAKHHGGGPTEVRLDLAGETAMVISVSDDGPGVAPSERQRIFERFARGGAARHRSGTGLGLALVAEHTAAHGGRVWVDEAPGGGASFHARLEHVR